MSLDDRRVRRVLGRHGRRLRPDGENWCVFPDGDRRRRPLICIDQAMLAQLIAAGVVSADESGGYGLGADLRDSPARDVTCPSRACSDRRSSGFAGLMFRAQDGLGPATVAQIRAGLRYRADVELASLAGRVTMNWDFMRSSACGSDRIPRGARARQRLRDLRRSVDRRDLELIHLACVEERSLASLERRFGLRQRSAGMALSAALERLRRAYDGYIAPGETTDISINEKAMSTIR